MFTSSILLNETAAKRQTKTAEKAKIIGRNSNQNNKTKKLGREKYYKKRPSLASVLAGSRKMFVSACLVRAVCIVVLFLDTNALNNDNSGLDVVTSASELDFNVTVDGNNFFQGAGAFVASQGQVFKTADGSLFLDGAPERDNGTDGLGSFSRVTYNLATKAVSGILLRASIKVYEDRQTAVFEQTFPNGIRNGPAVSVDGNDIGSAFPTFLVDNETRRGVLSFSGRFVESSRAGAWGSNHGRGPEMGVGIAGGPFAVFEDPFGAGNAIAVSHMTNFMAASFDIIPAQKCTKSQMYQHCVASGLLGSLTEIPQGFSVATLLVLERHGVSSSFKALGDRLLQFHAKNATEARSRDITLHKLGYDTANGAYYYYNQNMKKTYADTLVEVVDYAREIDMPLHWLEIDSWMYPHGSGGGVLVWDPIPGGDAFPNGLHTFHKRIGELPLMLHNRHWSANNWYATQNGGTYPFSIDNQTQLSVPLSQHFWDDLIGNKSDIGLKVYLQDWLYNEMQGNNITLQNATMGRTWLLQMSNAAVKNECGIQYCMTFPRMLMSSVELDAVSQWRASDDYGPGQTENCAFPYCVYYIGTTSLLSYALGLAPAKDNFWSTEWQPGSAYRNTTHEPYSEMQVVVAAYSTGPVTPSDGIGFSNMSLVLMACTMNGTLLQPSRPMSAIDACYGGDAFGYNAGQPQPYREHVYPVMSSHTSVPTKLSDETVPFEPRLWADILAIGLGGDGYNVTANDLPLDLDKSASSFVAWTGYSAHIGRANITLMAQSGRYELTKKRDATLVTLSACNYSDFLLWHLAPVIGKSSNVFLGEPAKFVPVSTRRVLEINASSTSDLRVKVWGDAGEKVEFAFANRKTGHITYIPCTFPSLSSGNLSNDGVTMIVSAASGACFY